MAPERHDLGTDVVPGDATRTRRSAAALDAHGGAIKRLRAWLTVTRAIGLMLAIIGPGAVIATIARAVIDRDVAQEVVRSAVQDGVRSELADRTAASRARGRAAVDGWNLCPDCTLGDRVRDAWDGLLPGSGTP